MVNTVGLLFVENNFVSKDFESMVTDSDYGQLTSQQTIEQKTGRIAPDSRCQEARTDTGSVDLWSRVRSSTQTSFS